MSVLKRAAVIAGVLLGVWGFAGLVGVADAAPTLNAAPAPPPDPAQPQPQPPPAPSAPRPGEITVKVARIGVGGRARPGDWAAVQVVLTNNTDRLREVLVRATIPDPDGDRAAYERTILSNPGATQSVWLYVYLPFSLARGTSVSVTAFEAEETGESGAARFRAGRELGSDVLTLSNPVLATASMIGVLGDRTAAVDQYVMRDNRYDYAPTGHELTEILGLQMPDLPDRVMGLLPFEAIVWTGAGQGREPTELSLDQAAAVREWVRRGGHLVVVLPQAGQAWLGRADNPLADIMPTATPMLFEGVDLNPMRRLLTDQETVTLPESFSVTTLKPDPAAGPYDAMPILSTPADLAAPGLADQPLVIRRLVGQGAVTIVGIDLSRPTLAAIRAVDADVFWNRVLGKRINLLRADELQDAQNKGYLNLPRSDKTLDGGISADIAKTAEAAAGLLLAFVVFGLYWLIAGPLGHFLLRRRDLRRHSWVGFVGVAGVFTALAWGGANAIRAKRVTGNHLTFIDHVYGQPSQRTRSWINVHVPRYGDVNIATGNAADPADDQWHASIAPWDDPDSGPGGWAGFPDSREYTVQARSPDDVNVPFRSTAKQLRVDWAGPIRDKWGMPRPLIDTQGGPVPALGKELQIKPESTGRGWSLSGQLVHDLPEPLTNVIVIVVPHQDRLSVGPRSPKVRQLVGDAVAIAISGEWPPGKPIDLGKTQLGDPDSTGKNSPDAVTWLGDILGHSGFRDQFTTREPTRTAPNDWTALAVYSMLEPPNLLDEDSRTFVARRRSTHTWDLGRWFTQPTVIVIGQIAEGPSPTPLRIDGDEVDLRGRTVVRWVYPLTPDPPEYGPRPQDQGSASAPAGSGPGTAPAAKPASQPPPQGRRRQ